MRWFHSLLLLASAVLALPPSLPAGEDPPVPPAAVPDRKAELRALMTALREDRHGEVIRRAGECLRWLEDPHWRFVVSQAAGQCSLALEDWEGCLRWCEAMDRELEAAKRKGGNLDEERGSRAALRGHALLQLGRLEEAAAEFVEARTRNPGLRRDYEIRKALAIARAEGAYWIDTDYRGKYEEDPRLPAALQSLRGCFSPALERIRRRLGLEALVLPPIVVVLVDAADLPEEGDGGFMAAERMTVNGEARAIIVVTAEPLLAGVADPVNGVSHELVHLLHIDTWEERKDPLWLGEGLAYRLARADDGELMERVLGHVVVFREVPVGEATEARARVSVSRALESRVFLESQEEGLQSVAGTVILHQVETLLGEERFRRLSLEMLRSPDPVAVLEKATDGTVDELLARVRKGYLAWARKDLPVDAGWEEVMEEGRKGNLARALELVDALPSASTETPLSPYRRYFRIRLLHRMGRWKEGIEAAREFRTLHPGHGLRSHALASEVMMLSESGDREGARDLARILLRDYSWNSAEMAALAKWILAEEK